MERDILCFFHLDTVLTGLNTLDLQAPPGHNDKSWVSSTIVARGRRTMTFQPPKGVESNLVISIYVEGRGVIPTKYVTICIVSASLYYNCLFHDPSFDSNYS